jgi:serine/threonine protein kinase/Tfp pilus assembly protein PilF
MGIKCPKCQSNNPDTQQYCGECGTHLVSLEEIPASPTKTLEIPTEELTTGSTFAGRYQIIEELGKGGMGNVYKVLDKEVNAKIALKLINPEIAADKKTIERFRNELKTARDISHKNICRMYDLNKEEGSYYITMEYVEGQDLKSLIRQTGQLAIPTTISIAKQVCEGLSEAHKLGTVHRDLKPSNIMIDKEGNSRIMDFGIARSLSAKGITGAGVMIGTPEYMSPEQAEVKEVDQRSDIYSLGVILYEMVTGRVPFEGETPLGIAMKHKSEMPKNPREINAQIPEELSRVILRCMEKDKENRYQSAIIVHSELENIEKGIPTTERVVPKRKPITSKEITVTFGLKKLLIPALVVIALVIAAVIILRMLPGKQASIAVLPFTDLSPQKDQEYLCDGMTDEIIAKLSRLQGWKVMNMTSVMRYKNTGKDIKEIGRELNVSTILEGRIRKEKDDIRVTAQLVNVEDGFQLWSETYEQKLEGVFDIQSDIAEKITKALKVKLSPEEKEQIQKKPTENIEAYNLYLQGRWFWNMRTGKEMETSIKYFEQSIENDPNYALAYVGLADSYITLADWVYLRSKEAYFKAKEAATKALEIDDSLAEAHNSIAIIKYMYESDWLNAEKEFKRAITLNPNYAAARQEYAEYLACLGRFDEALKEIKQAQKLDPLSLMFSASEANFLYYARDYDHAIEQNKKTLEMDPNFRPAHVYLGRSYREKGIYEKALEEFKKINSQIDIGITLAKMGKKPEAHQVIKDYTEDTIQSDSPLSLENVARIYFSMEEEDQGFKWLKRAYEEKESLRFLKVHPLYDRVRSDPRFKALIKKVGLE